MKSKTVGNVFLWIVGILAILGIVSALAPSRQEHVFTAGEVSAAVATAQAELTGIPVAQPKHSVADDLAPSTDWAKEIKIADAEQRQAATIRDLQEQVNDLQRHSDYQDEQQRKQDFAEKYGGCYTRGIEIICH
jgi:hypothetical protein